LVEGFKENGQQGFAFLGIACFLFTLTTFFLQFKIIQGALSDAARIPVYLQLTFCVFFGISILITMNTNWHPEELNCYYDNPGTFVRKTGNPKCWNPPSNGNCFGRTSQCMMYISNGGVGDICAPNIGITNQTSGNTHYKCEYIYKPPTPRPTTTTTTTQSLNAFESVENNQNIQNEHH